MVKCVLIWLKILDNIMIRCKSTELDIYSEINTKNLFLENVKQDTTLMSYINSLSSNNVGYIIHYINRYLLIPEIVFNINIGGKHICYDDIIVELNCVLMGELYKEKTLMNQGDIRIMITTEYIKLFDNTYKKIIEDTIKKLSRYTNIKTININISEYIHFNNYTFLIVCNGQLELKKSSKKNKFSYKLSICLNITGISMPTIENLRKILVEQ